MRSLGRLIWATYLGSPGYDRAYGIEVDAEGYVYVAGRSGRGFPTTPGAFQPTFQGYNGGGYGGYQNAFVAKLAPAGTIALDPSRTYQTIRGWEAVAFALEPTDPAFPNFKDTLIDQAVNAAIPQAGVLTVYSKPVLSDSQPPSVPTQLAAKETTPAQITLTWNAATDDVGVAGYKIYRDGVRLGFSVTPSFDDANVQPGASYTYEITAYDAAGNESPRSTSLVVAVAPPPPGADLPGCWKFDDGQGVTAADSSVYTHHGTVFGAAWVPGTIGQAPAFDGVNDYVQIPRDASLDNLQGLTNGSAQNRPSLQESNRAETPEGQR